MNERSVRGGDRRSRVQFELLAGVEGGEGLEREFGVGAACVEALLRERAGDERLGKRLVGLGLFLGLPRS